QGTFHLESDLVVPAGVILGFVPGATLQGDQHVLVEGQIDAGLHQIFDGPRVEFRPGRMEYVLPQWWGALGDGVHDDTDALQSALSARIVFVPAGRYRTTRELVVANRSTIVGV